MSGWGIAAQAGAQLLGSYMAYQGAKSDRDLQEEMFQQNMQAQREFAQQGIRWRVADAQAAGIHPLYALGASTHSFAPIAYMGGSGDGGAGGILANAGQDIGRAIDATRTNDERLEARYQAVQRALTLDNMELQNDLLRSQIARINQQGNPAMPNAAGGIAASSPGLEGQGDVGRYGLVKTEVLPAPAHIQDKAMERAVNMPGRPSLEPGAITDTGFAKTATGYAPVPSKDVKERIEDMPVSEFLWWIRNGGTNSWEHLSSGNRSYSNPPPLDWLPEGAFKWTWSIAKQEWQPVFGASGSLPGRR